MTSIRRVPGSRPLRLPSPRLLRDPSLMGRGGTGAAHLKPDGGGAAQRPGLHEGVGLRLGREHGQGRGGEQQCGGRGARQGLLLMVAAVAPARHRQGQAHDQH